MSSLKMIPRHTKAGIFIHWFNAACWLFLLITGLALIQNPELNPLGAWYPKAVRAVFGGGANLLVAHWVVALLWLAVWVVYLFWGMNRFVAPFLYSVFTLEPNRDIQWMIKKNLQMILGYKMMAKLVKPLGYDGHLPPQEYYNAGQKVAAQGIIIGALVLVGTGFIMLFSKYFFTAADTWLVQWSITVHFIAAGVTTALLMVHIYMAAISKEERPAFISMFTGKVPEEYAKHHHQLWYEELEEK
ncbi:MAG: cytochrome b/b6 domain-containing protein [Deltaproteobacteria bacterium]|nr:cytochrome b/b6 domain-containing protein [Deltaproteobacteria bacterium]